MKSDIHPKYKNITVTCSCGNRFEVGSTLEKNLTIEVCDHCHPFYSGEQKIIDTKGRVERYKSRYEMPRTPQVQAAPKEAEIKKKKSPASKTKKETAKSTKSVKKGTKSKVAPKEKKKTKSS